MCVGVRVGVNVAVGCTGVFVGVKVAVNVAVEGTEVFVGVKVGVNVTVGGTEVLVGVKVAVKVAVGGTEVFVGTEDTSNSYAPISQPLPCGRVTPRWSVALQALLSPPASSAELPTPRALVWVKPPLFASTPSNGFVVIILVPPTNPPWITLSTIVVLPVPSLVISSEPLPHKILL